MRKNNYEIILSRHVTEKATMLSGLWEKESNASLKKCELPKYVFRVHPKANKIEIARALEEIYAQKKVKVVSVNTINVKPKPRRLRGIKGDTRKFKKAIVTFSKNDRLDA